MEQLERSASMPNLNIDLSGMLGHPAAAASSTGPYTPPNTQQISTCILTKNEEGIPIVN